MKPLPPARAGNHPGNPGGTGRGLVAPESFHNLCPKMRGLFPSASS